MKGLIVSADDFGLTEGINEAVIKCFKDGIITSASLIPNMPSFDHAVNLAKKYSSLAIGIHLNLLKGRPIESQNKLFSLVDKNGIFHPLPELIKRLLFRKIVFSEVENEFRNQIEKILSTNLKVTHLDSHRHIHVYPPILNIVIKLAKEYGIMKIRCPLEDFSFPRNLKKFFLKLFSRKCLSVFERKGIRSNQRFFDLVKIETSDDPIYTFEKFCKNLPYGITDLSCHPGVVTRELDGIEATIHNRAKQIKILVNPDISKIINKHGIKLINYGNSLG